MLNKYLKKPLSCIAFASLVAMGSAVTVSGADTLMVNRSFNLGSPAAINGLAFGISEGQALLYGADTTSRLLRIINIASGAEVRSISSGGTWLAGVATGAGNYPVEYYVLPGDGRMLRYNLAAGAFQNAFWLPEKITALESSDSTKPYADFWAINPATTGLLRLNYTGSPKILQVIENVGTGLTDLAVDTQGEKLYALGDSTIYQYSTAGDLLMTYALDPSIAKPVGIAYDSISKTLWISNGSSTLYQLQQISIP